MEIQERGSMDRKGVVAEFLQRCIDYSDKSISRKTERGEIEEVKPWEIYREFTKHALMEVHTGKLDSWFESVESSDLKNPRRIDTESLDRQERASWISGILSPRPLILASTQDENGLRNLAPLTSVMTVSNRPPLIIASLSQNRDGRFRDTLLNLRSTGKAILHLMPSTLEAVDWIDTAGTPIPKSESEWDLTKLTSHDQEKLLVSQAVAGLEVELVEERELPGAVAKLVILKITHIWTSLDNPPLEGIDTLCQHGIDRLTPSPNGWSKTVDKHYG